MSKITNYKRMTRKSDVNNDLLLNNVVVHIQFCPRSFRNADITVVHGYKVSST